jgi:hypothetical protein
MLFAAVGSEIEVSGELTNGSGSAGDDPGDGSLLPPPTTGGRVPLEPAGVVTPSMEGHTGITERLALEPPPVLDFDAFLHA